MAHVTGIGGIFFKARDPETLYEWYERHLGIRRAPDGSGVLFSWDTPDEVGRQGTTVLAIFPQDTTYLGHAAASFMLNFRVNDLDKLVEQLNQAGVSVDLHREDYEYGRFAWLHDPEGNRIELWEPPRTV